jgi:methyltransferase family protein
MDSVKAPPGKRLLRWGFGRIHWLDRLLWPMVYAAARLLGFVRWAGVDRMPLSRRALRAAGTFPIRSHYYEPAFDFAYLRTPLSLPRNLPGLDLRVPGQLALLTLLAELKYGSEVADVPLHPGSGPGFHLKNGFFEGGEADLWYALIRRFKPARIFEIGSGFSTLMAIKAIAENRRENPDYRCRHVCIEPFEKPWLDGLAVELIRKRVEELDPAFFDALTADDFLFIDSSHVIRPQGDVLFEFQHILPRLNKGVIVHFHDIYTPMDYPEKWVIDEVRMWNEQYLLEVFLAANGGAWSILIAAFYLFKSHPDALRAACPLLATDSEPSSLYIRKSG